MTKSGNSFLLILLVIPTLWVLSNNQAAISLYHREGYEFTGNRLELRSDLAELEMQHSIFT